MALSRYSVAMRPRVPISEAEVLDAIRVCRGDVEAASQLLGVSSRTLRRRMRDYGIRSTVRYEKGDKEAA